MAYFTKRELRLRRGQFAITRFCNLSDNGEMATLACDIPAYITEIQRLHSVTAKLRRQIKKLKYCLTS